MEIIGWIVIGALAGALARLLVPGRDPMGCLTTMLLGILGSFVGGFLASLVFYGEIDWRASGNFIGAVVGAIVVLLIWRTVTGGRRSGRRR